MKKQSYDMTGGFSLMEILVAVGLTGLLATTLSRFLSNQQKSLESFNLQAEVFEIKNDLSMRVNCQKTAEFATNRFGSSWPNFNVQMNLVDSRGAVLGQSGLGSGPLAGKIRVGSNWFLDVVWTGTAFQVKAAKATRDGSGFLNDPMTGAPLNFDVPHHILYGSASNAFPLCPRNSAQSTLNGVIIARMAQMGPLVGLAATSTTEDLMNSMKVDTACERLCRNNSYTTGYSIGWSDRDYIYDAGGNFISADLFPLGQGVVYCNCFE